MKQSASILASVCGILFLIVVSTVFPLIDFVLADSELLNVVAPSYVATPIATFVFGLFVLIISPAPVTNLVREVVKDLLVAVFSFVWLFGLCYVRSFYPYYTILLLLATYAIMIIVAIIKANKETK